MQTKDSMNFLTRTARTRTNPRMAATALAMVAGMAGATTTAQAATKTWDGGGAGNTLFSTKYNWNVDVAPTSVDNATIGGSFAATLNASTPDTLRSLTIAAGASLTNAQSGGSYELRALTLTNNGLIDVNGGTQLATPTNNDAVTNAGTIQATKGTFVFQGLNPIINNTGGTIRAAAMGTIKAQINTTFNGGALTIDTGGTFTGSGNDETFTLSGVTTTINGTLINSEIASPGDGSSFAKLLVINGGTFSVGATGLLDARSIDPKTTSLQGTEKVQVKTGTTFTTVAGGQINLQNNNNFSVTDPTKNTNKAGAASFVIDSGANFSNAGTMNVSNVSTSTNTGAGSAQTTLLQIDTAAANFANTGTINVSDASTAAAGHSTRVVASAGLANAGTFNAANATSSIDVTGAYNQSAGKTVLNTGSKLTASTGIAVTGGFLSGDTGTFTAPTIGIDSGGEVAPGSAGIGTVGTLNFVGDTIFGNSSILNIDLAGDTIDVLAITGNIDLSSLSDAVTVAATGTRNLTRYVFATYTGMRTGTFDGFTLPSGLALDYSVAHEIAVAVPEPTSVAALSLLGLAAMRRRRASR